MNLTAFFAMGGYGAYVWSCYGLTAAVLILMAWRARAEFKAEILRTQRRNQAAASAQP
jgi:heme exporter protein CcmD